MAEFKEVIGTIGKAIAVAGVFAGKNIAVAGAFAGKKAVEGYHFIDPDLRRHIFQTPLLIHTLLIPRTEKITAREPDGYRPIVFVHGMGGNRGNFYLMAKYLAYHGRKRCYMIHFTGGLSTSEMAAQLKAFVEEVVEVTSEEKVDVVAHSLGGLVVRLAIADYELGRFINKLVTMGTPHKGTFPARFATAQKIMDLRPGSSFIERLEKAGIPENIKCYSFWSRSDLLILPPESAIMDKSAAIEAVNFTHYSYILSPASWINVYKVLQ